MPINSLVSLRSPLEAGLSISVTQAPGESYSHDGDLYYGWDFVLTNGSILGANVLAAADGEVVYVEEAVPDGAAASGSYGTQTTARDPSLGSPGALGNVVTLAHNIDGNIFYTSYMQLAENSVPLEVGDMVVAGQVLGRVGSTGVRSDTHLHFNFGETLGAYTNGSGDNFSHYQITEGSNDDGALIPFINFFDSPNTGSELFAGDTFTSTATALGANAVVTIRDEYLVNSETANDQSLPTITELNNGDFVVAWSDASNTLGDNNGSSIKAKIFAADGTLIQSEFLVNSETASDQDSPAIAGLINGSFVVAWQDDSRTLGDNYGDSIKAKIFASDGALIRDEFLVNSEGRGSQMAPTVAGLSNGGFVVAWEDPSKTLGDTSWNSIKAKIFAADGTLVKDEFLVNSETYNAQFGPTIAGLDNGGFVVAWRDSSYTLGDNHGTSIKAKIFAANGTLVQDEFLINSQVTGNQLAPTITGLSDGNFVVAWRDNGLGDNSGSSIIAKIFASDGTLIQDDFLVNSETISFQVNPKVTGLSDGGFVVAWEDWSGTLGDNSATSIKAKVFAADGTLVQDEFLVNDEVSNYQVDPTITGLRNGGFVVAWGDDSGTLGDNSGFSIKAKIFSVDDTTGLDDTQSLFDTHGKLGFLAQLALAAYHLEDRELEGLGLQTNNLKPAGEDAYDQLAGVKLLNASDLAGLGVQPSGLVPFPTNGLSNGIYTNENAAALVARSSDALFLSFRGTNDNEGEAGFFNPLNPWGDHHFDTPDESHWVGMGDHYALFADLLTAISSYVTKNGIQKVYVTGHSLGASMVEKFMDDHAGVNIEAVTFASPGYGLPDDLGEPRMTNFWVDGDVILIPSKLSDNDGDANRIYHNLNNLAAGELHNMALYSSFASFFQANGIGLQQMNSKVLNGMIEYDRIYADVYQNPTSGAFEVGVGGTIMHGSLGHEVILGGEGNDTIYSSAGFDYVKSGTGHDSVWGGDGRDKVYLGKGNDRFVDNNQSGEYGQDTVFGGDGNDTIHGQGGTNTGLGGGGNDVLHGEGHNDSILGGAGNDSLYGGWGEDTLKAGSDDDQVWGGDGPDKVWLGSGADRFFDNGQSGVLGEDLVYGGSGNDTIRGGGGNDTFHGENDKDSIFGGAGNDTLYGGSDFDTLYGGDGDDKIWGGNGRDEVYLGNNNDEFFDNTQGTYFGGDRVYGGFGDDTIHAGGGDDTLTGGPGSDTFIFQSGMADDLITDFFAAEDRLHLHMSLWGGAALSASQVINQYASAKNGEILFDFGFFNSDTLTLQTAASLAEIESSLTVFG